MAGQTSTRLGVLIVRFLYGVQLTFKLVLKSLVIFRRVKRARYYTAYSMPISYGSQTVNSAY